MTGRPAAKVSNSLSGATPVAARPETSTIGDEAGQRADDQAGNRGVGLAAEVVDARIACGGGLDQRAVGAGADDDEIDAVRPGGMGDRVEHHARAVPDRECAEEDDVGLVRRTRSGGRSGENRSVLAALEISATSVAAALALEPLHELVRHRDDGARVPVLPALHGDEQRQQRPSPGVRDGDVGVGAVAFVDDGDAAQAGRHRDRQQQWIGPAIDRVGLAEPAPRPPIDAGDRGQPAHKTGAASRLVVGRLDQRRPPAAPGEAGHDLGDVHVGRRALGEGLGRHVQHRSGSEDKVAARRLGTAGARRDRAGSIPEG